MVVHRHHVSVVDPRRCLRLAAEPLAIVRIEVAVRSDQLEDTLDVECEVRHEIDIAHPTGPDLSLDAVAGEEHPSRKRVHQCLLYRPSALGTTRI